MATIMVTGAGGGLASQVIQMLDARGDDVVAVDYRTIEEDLPPRVRFYKASYNKTGIEDVFRHHKFDVVLHLGRVGDLRQNPGMRFDLNVVGTQKIMNLCATNGVRRMVVLSTFHIYGAHPANHTPILEEDPLRAGLEFPEIGDAIQLDNMASTWVWRHPEVHTAVLRVVNVVGPDIKNTMSQFLRGQKVPYLLGFNPMTQFIHQSDLAQAIIAAADKHIPGVFNIAGPDVVPWRTALKLAGASVYPIPGSLVQGFLKLSGAFPAYLINFFRYPCIISDKVFRETFDWKPLLSLEETIWSTVAGVREEQRRREHRR